MALFRKHQQSFSQISFRTYFTSIHISKVSELMGFCHQGAMNPSLDSSLIGPFRFGTIFVLHRKSPYLSFTIGFSFMKRSTHVELKCTTHVSGHFKTCRLSVSNWCQTLFLSTSTLETLHLRMVQSTSQRFPHKLTQIIPRLQKMRETF